jgi:hypothetical protein
MAEVFSSTNPFAALAYELQLTPTNPISFIYVCEHENSFLRPLIQNHSPMANWYLSQNESLLRIPS